ncbi:MAG: hypothetical protein WAN34_10015 [Acidimicrobiia bacterium]
MTMEPPATPEPTPEPPPEPTPAAASPMSSMSGETMVMAGAALVLVSYVIFTLLTRDFSQYPTVLYAATFAIILSRFSAPWIEKLAPVPVLMKLLGYLIALVGVFEILYDIRVGVLDHVMPILGALVAYIGYVLAFLGARSIKA